MRSDMYLDGWTGVAKLLASASKLAGAGIMDAVITMSEIMMQP